MEKAKASWISRLIARPLMTIALIGALLIAANNTKAEASASPETAHSFYAVEFSYKNGAQTVRYATRDVAKISVSVIAEQLGLIGEVTSVTASDPYGYYSASQENGQWYIRTVGTPTNSSGDLYTGDLFGGLTGRYYNANYNVAVITTENAYSLTMRFIATPIQLNNPGAIDGVTVGDTIYTFASGMPLSTVYIDNDYFKTPTGFEKLTAEAGFVLRLPNEFPGLSNQVWAIYDPTVSGATKLKAGMETSFNGPLFSFTFDNAAVLSDGTVANVKITYSDARITVDDRTGSAGFPYSISLASGKTLDVKTSDTRTGSSSPYFKAYSAAVTMIATIQIVDDSGTPIEGSFIACVEGINIFRHATTATRPLYNGPQYDFWSESIQVNSGTLSEIYVRPNNNEEEPLSGMPGENPKYYQRRYYYSEVSKNNEGIRFTGTYWAVPDAASSPSTVITAGYNYYYSAGFVTTADAAAGIQMRNYSSGNLGYSYETTYMNGYSIWHRIRSSSSRGGTIQTTAKGNTGGSLSDGGTVLDPGTYVVPDGKTVIYTMTPEEGYELDKVIVKSDSLSYSNGNDITDLVKATVVYDDSGAIAYYTYTFPANMKNQAIHVKWVKSVSEDLTIHKTTVDGDGTFVFHVNVHGDRRHLDAWKAIASWETVWRQKYSFAHITSVSYPLVLDGVVYNDDIEQMSLTDGSAKLLLGGSCAEGGSPAETQLTDTNSGRTLTLYRVLASDGSPYTVTIDETQYDLYSDTKDWAVSGTEGSNEANFWIHDTEDKVDNFFDVLTVTEARTPETVDLSQAPYNGTAVSGKPGFYEFTITTTNGEGSLTLPDLPYGYEYQTEEILQSGWTLTDSHNTSGTLTAMHTASFTNTKNHYGDLTVTKTVEGNDASTTKEFSFTVALSDTSVNGTYGDMTFTNGVASFTLKDSESKTAANLLHGITYTVTEADYSADGYITAKTGDTGSIEEGNPAVAAFTNTRNTFGGLTVTKTVGGNAASTTQEFSFTVTLSDTSINDTYGEMTFTDGVASFTLKDGESKTADGLPNGISYEVAEEDYTADGYVTTKTGDTGTITGGSVMSAAFTNTKNIPEYGDLTVKKTVKGDLAETDRDFSFTITFDAEGSYSYIGSKSGTIASGGTVYLKHGESITISGLPAGAAYSVTESGNGDYHTEASGDTGTIPANGTAVADFTNIKNSIPQTGDDSNLTLWLSIAGISGLGIVLLLILGKRRRSKHDAEA